MEVSRTRIAISAYAELFVTPQLSMVHGDQYSIPIHTDGAVSPEAGRVVIGDGKAVLQENKGGQYRVIAVFKPGQKPSIRNEPSQIFVDALEYRVTERQVSEIDREEFDQEMAKIEMAKILREYSADRTPDTVIVAEYTPRPSEKILFPRKYLGALNARGRHVQDTPAIGLVSFIPEGHYEARPAKEESVSSGPYQSPFGVISAHADETGVFVIEGQLSELLKQLSQRTGWRVDSNNSHR